MPDSDLALLLVEDDPQVSASLRRILALDGYRVDTAETLAETLDRDNWSDYFALILDRKLPDGNSDEILPQLRHLAPNARILVVTAYSDIEGTIAALRNGVADYFLKPVDADLLRTTLKRIIDSRRAKQLLQESEERQRRIIESAIEAIVVMDTDGTITEWNPRAATIFGWSADKVIGKPLAETIIPERFREAHRKGLEAYFASGEEKLPNERRELTAMRRDGGEFPIEVSIVPLTVRDGTVFCGFVEDITNRKRAKQNERLAAMGQVLSAIAHESRNALQRIQAGVEMLRMDLEDNPDVLPDLNRIEKASDNLTKLYDELREYAAPLNLDRQTYDLREIWQQAWANLGHVRQDRQTELRDQTNGLDLHFRVDEFRIEQVFRNLMENSLAASSDRAEIDIICHDTQHEGAPAVCVCVRDNGPGLTNEQKNRVFEPFFTTKSKGTGLGMAIAQRIMEAHQGNIAVGVGQHNGAEFIITLPREER
jgi:hypothetical protein